MSALRTVTVKKGDVHLGKKSEDICQKMGRRKKMYEDKRDKAKVT